MIDDVASNKALVRQTASHAAHQQPTLLSQSLIKRKEARSIKPDYHPQWKLTRVISGHLGWVRSVAVEPGNQWFATGAGDRVIKIWDLASGELKLSLTGHISTVRGLAISPRHPYMFSAGEDKMVKCWDLEQNKVIRHYHGHLSAVYSLALHPTLDLLVTGGRDAAARVWDMRTKQCIHTMTGHTATIADVKCQESDPQVLTGSMDSTIRLWDIVAGKTMTQLTHHHKSVRSLTVHPTELVSHQVQLEETTSRNTLSQTGHSCTTSAVTTVSSIPSTSMRMVYSTLGQIMGLRHSGTGRQDCHSRLSRIRRKQDRSTQSQASSARLSTRVDPDSSPVVQTRQSRSSAKCRNDQKLPID